MRRIGEGIGQAAMGNQSGNGNGSKPKVDWTLNVPAMLTAIGFAVGIFTYVNNQDRRISAVEQSVLVANERAAKYVPVIESAVMKNELQDAQNRVQEERIQNLSVAVQDLRKVNTEVMSLLGNIREDLAVIRVKLSIEPSQKRTEKR